VAGCGTRAVGVAQGPLDLAMVGGQGWHIVPRAATASHGAICMSCSCMSAIHGNGVHSSGRGAINSRCEFVRSLGLVRLIASKPFSQQSG